jgi:cytochrome c peroxidase
LETQVLKSLRTTMHGPEPSDERVNALTAFIRALRPARSPIEDAPSVERGKNLFERQGCAACHAPPAYTSAKAYDVGFVDELGNSRFNPPSLRGVGLGGPFFHDNRASTLSEVFTRFRHQLKSDLSEAELRDLISFLTSL